MDRDHQRYSEVVYKALDEFWERAFAAGVASERERVAPIILAARKVLAVRRENPEMHGRLCALSDALRSVDES